MVVSPGEGPDPHPPAAFPQPHPKASLCFPRASQSPLSCTVQPPQWPPPLCPCRTRCRCPRSAVAEPPPGVTLSRRLSATKRSPPSASHAAADGGGDICLRVTHLTVAVCPPPPFALDAGALSPPGRSGMGKGRSGGPPHRPPPLPQAPPTSAPLISLHPPPRSPLPRGWSTGVARGAPSPRASAHHHRVFEGGVGWGPGTGDSCSFSVFCLN